jgi:hypothetical protein
MATTVTTSLSMEDGVTSIQLLGQRGFGSLSSDE